MHTILEFARMFALYLCKVSYLILHQGLVWKIFALLGLEF